MRSERGRRAGTYAEMCDYLKLIQSPQHAAPGGRRAVRAARPARRTRAISISTMPRSRCSTRTGSRRRWARDAPIDALEMVAISLGTTRERLIDRCRSSPASSTPIRPAARRADGGRADRLAEHGQVQSSSRRSRWPARCSPVTLAGALVAAACRGLAGIVLCQIVRPGVPVMYGGFTSNVDMTLRRAGLRHARIYAGRAGHRPALPADRRAVPLEQCDRRQ